MSQRERDERRLVSAYPGIDWLRPQPVQTPEGRWLTCRICTALKGLRAVDLPNVGYATYVACTDHIAEQHSHLVELGAVAP